MSLLFLVTFRFVFSKNGNSKLLFIIFFYWTIIDYYIFLRRLVQRSWLNTDALIGVRIDIKISSVTSICVFRWRWDSTVTTNIAETHHNPSLRLSWSELKLINQLFQGKIRQKPLTMSHKTLGTDTKPGTFTYFTIQYICTSSYFIIHHLMDTKSLS